MGAAERAAAGCTQGRKKLWGKGEVGDWKGDRNGKAEVDSQGSKCASKQGRNWRRVNKEERLVGRIICCAGGMHRAARQRRGRA